MKDIINYIKEELIDTKQSIIDRASIYRDKTWDIEDLFDIDMDKYPVSHFNIEDLCNHNYDLARYNTLKEILNKITN